MNARFLSCVVTTMALGLSCAHTASSGLEPQAEFDALSARLEELRTREDADCGEAPNRRQETCDISVKLCALAARSTDRADFQQHCALSQEDCALAGDRAGRCPR
jgi:hypothetical protein